MKNTTFITALKPELASLDPAVKAEIKNEFFRENYLKLKWITIFVFISQMLFIVRDYFAGFYLASEWNIINFATSVIAGLVSLVYYLYIISNQKSLGNKASVVLYNIYMCLVILTVCAYTFTDMFVRHADFGVCICFLVIPIIAPCYHIFEQIILFGFIALFSGLTYLFCFDMQYLGTIGVIFLPLLMLLTSCFLRSYFLNTLISRNKTKVLTEELTYRSKTDFLTDVSSRFCLYEDYSSAQALKLPIGVVMYDIDDFKKYNDEFSHIGGDKCLKKTCDAVKAFALAHNGKVYRFGGEEFVVIFFDIERDEFETLLPGVISSVYDLKIPHGKAALHPYVSVSAGAVFVEDLRVTLEELLLDCDNTLYKAKANGKNCFILKN